MTRLLAFPLLLILVCSTVAVVRGHHPNAAGRVEGPSLSAAPRLAGLDVPTPLTRVASSPRHGTQPRHHPKPLRTIRLDITAYCETGNRTASGVWPRYGMAASNLFPFGTRLRVPGWPVVVTVTDRVGWGADLDLYAMSCERAIQWGRRSLLVEVLSR